MVKAFDFTRKKFQSFPETKQHKKCAELLDILYRKIVHLQDATIEWETYQSFLVWMNDTWLEKMKLETHSTKEIANRLYEHEQKAGISKKEHHLLPRLPKVRKGDKGEADAQAVWPITVYLDQIRSAHNVGSIIRTVEAFSLGQIIFSKNTPFITHKQVKDTSMETFEWVTCHREEEETPVFSKPFIALETCENAISLFDFTFPDSFTLAVGNEEYGCSDETLLKADYIIEIPLRGRKNSLNVANAFAIIAAEISRQRQMKKEP